MAHPDPESTSIILQILLLVFLTALNAFFSASEMALVSLSRSRVEQKRVKAMSSINTCLV